MYGSSSNGNSSTYHPWNLLSIAILSLEISCLPVEDTTDQHLKHVFQNRKTFFGCLLFSQKLFFIVTGLHLHYIDCKAFNYSIPCIYVTLHISFNRYFIPNRSKVKEIKKILQIFWNNELCISCFLCFLSWCLFLMIMHSS